MSRPKLQLACDHNDFPSALADISKIGTIVDVIEAGTILILQEGIEVVKNFRALYPDKLIVADTKCADAGTVVAKNCADAGADLMTVICAATIATMKAAAKELQGIQIELYGDLSFEQAEKWLAEGIDTVVYHQSRDLVNDGNLWSKKDIGKVKQLVDMGFRVSVTGGLEVETLQLFEGMNIDTFITGRAITAADNPIEAAEKFQKEIQRIWKGDLKT